MSRKTTVSPADPTRRPRRVLVSLAATALVGTCLPLTAAPAYAAEGDAAFAGYSSTTSSTPVRIEIYEPTIPIPSTPQAEINLGYSVVKADSTSSRGRAAFVWPGDAVGEGFKTIVENLGFPPELSGPLGENGYPVQVNSQHPAGPEREADEPFPGVINRTRATENKTFAEVGYSTDCRLGDPGAGSDGGGGGGGLPGLPGLPGIPGLPEIPGLGSLTGSNGGLLGGLTGALGGSRAEAQGSAPAAEDEVACQIPAQLAALVDIGGYAAESVVTSEPTEVRAVSRSAVGDVSLLGGVVTLSGITARAVASSDGAKGSTAGEADYGVLTIAGQKFRFGSSGFEAAGQASPIPGLPSDPGKALAALGIQLLLPEPSFEKDGAKATTTVQGLQVVLDTPLLRQQLDALPLNALADLIDLIPEEAGQLKSLLGAAVNLAPKIVITLGNASSVVETSQAVDLPVGEIPDNNTTGDPTSGTGGPGDSLGGDSGSAGTPGTPGTPAEPAVPGSDGGADGDLLDAAPVGAGLPALFSIPGALLFGALIGATIAGSYLRRLGLLALGGGAACPHGLDTGLPDLRKA